MNLGNEQRQLIAEVAFIVEQIKVESDFQFRCWLVGLADRLRTYHDGFYGRARVAGR